MKSKNALCGISMAVVLQLGVLPGSAQTNKYLFTWSETNITLNPGAYIITAYGALGGKTSYGGSLGAEMSAEFNFSASTTLTLLVGGGGAPGGGGGGSFVVEGSKPLVIAGGGGGGGRAYGGGSGLITISGGRASVSPSGPGGTNGLGGGFVSTNGGGGGDVNGGGGGFAFVDGGDGGVGTGIDSNGGYGGGGGGGGSIIYSSAIAILTEVSGAYSPDGGNGEVIITAIPTPVAIATGASFGFTNRAFGFDVIGLAGSNVVIQASSDFANLASAPNQSARQRLAPFVRFAVLRQYPAFLPRGIIAVRHDASTSHSMK